MTRVIHAISGADADHFLQGLITNDLEKMGGGLLYAAILTPQGKYLADFLLHRHEGAILLDVASELSVGLIRRLAMYKLRADVTISETPLKVWRGTGPAPPGALADPRHAALGWRRYGESEGDDGSDFDAIRVAHCIPESGIELTPETFILEAGFERLNGVDFRKGCYVGQEVTARMKHKTDLRKGLVTVEVSGIVPVGTEILAQGKPAGTIYTQAQGRGIAHLRFDRATAPMQADDVAVSRPG